MKHCIVLLIVLLMLIIHSQSNAQGRKYELGVIIGEPTGLSMKLWTSDINAIDFGLGWSLRAERGPGYYTGSDRIHFHMDYLWHSFDAIHSSERFPLFYGVGGLLNTGAGYDNTVAVRGVFGISWLPHNTSLDVFLELVPSLQLVTTSAITFNAAFGLRIFL